MMVEKILYIFHTSSIYLIITIANLFNKRTYGGTEGDIIIGRAGNDTIYGEQGGDLIFSEFATVSLQLTSSSLLSTSTLSAEASFDPLCSPNTIDGGIGDDVLVGGNHDGILYL